MAEYIIHLSIVLTVIVLLVALLRGNSKKSDTSITGNENLKIEEKNEMNGYFTGVGGEKQ